jgi:hypothetical protein
VARVFGGAAMTAHAMPDAFACTPKNNPIAIEIIKAVHRIMQSLNSQRPLVQSDQASVDLVIKIVTIRLQKGHHGLCF